MILIQYGSKMLINTGKNTPIIESNDDKRIFSQTKIDEIVLHPMHGAPPPPPTHITSESAPTEPRPSYYFPHQIHQQDSSVGEGSSWWIRMFEHLPKSTLMIQSHSNCNIILSCICEGSFCNLSKVSLSIQKKIKLTHPLFLAVVLDKVFASFLMKTFYLKVFLKYYPIIFPLSVKRCSLPWTFESGEEL